MYTLYIDTHFVKLVLAVLKDGKLILKKEMESDHQAEYTVSLLEELLNDLNLVPEDLNQIVVISGPGSFTGVRIGVVIAKMIGYTLNIPIKALTYLEAIDLLYHEDVVLGIKDRNGAFIGEFNKNHELLKDYYYLSNQELKIVNQTVLFDDKIDLEKVIEYVKDKENIQPHLLKPLYVKKIEVEKWLEKLH